MLGGTRTLKAGELLTLVGELHRNHETGTLVLQGGGTTKYLYFQDGQVVFAASNAPEDKFTHILTEEGQLTEQQLQMALEKKGNRTVGKALVELGFLSSADLLHALVMQVHRVAMSSLVWAVGEATFKPNVLPAGVAKLPISTPRFILDLAQQIENRAWVGQILGGMETVLKTSSAEREAAVTTGLQEEEQKILDLINGKRSVRELCAASQVDLFRGAKFCLGLSIAGIAHVSGLIHHPQESTASKPLDLSFLDSMIPSQKAEVASEKVETPFQSPGPEPVQIAQPVSQEESPAPPPSEPEQVPMAPPISQKEPPEPPPQFFSSEALSAPVPPAEEHIEFSYSEPPPVEPSSFAPSLDPFADALSGITPSPPPEPIESPPPGPEVAKSVLPKFGKSAMRSPGKGPSNPQLFENLPAPVVVETPAAKSVSRVAVQKRGGSGKGKVLVAVAAVLLMFGGIAGGGYWWLFVRSQTAPPVEKPQVSKPIPAKPPAPVDTHAPKPAPTAGRPDAPESAGSGALPTPNGGVLQSGTATTAPPTLSITVPAASSTPKQEPAQAEPPKAAPTVSAPVQPPPSKPVVPTAPGPVSVPISGATTLSTPEVRQTLLDGNYGEAAAAFAYQARNTTAAFTINIEVACQPDTITKGLSAAGGNEAFFILPYDLKGRACFSVFWGLYPDRSSAEKAMSTLPAFFRESAQPKVVPWSAVKK